MLISYQSSFVFKIGKVLTSRILLTYVYTEEKGDPQITYGQYTDRDKMYHSDIVTRSVHPRDKSTSNVRHPVLLFVVVYPFVNYLSYYYLRSSF